ncbi:MAG: polysaccharide deacetylase family protein [Dysosmobacter sp.]
MPRAASALTGYQGILGYRTNTDTKVWNDELEANRLKECEAVKPIIAELKRTGWTFGSHTWGHINLSSSSLERVKADTKRWMDEVGSLIGPTPILYYPHGARPDGDDVQSTGPIFKYLQEQGFRVFASVGISSYSKIKTDICAVICDRLHPGRHHPSGQRQGHRLVQPVLRCQRHHKLGRAPQPGREVDAEIRVLIAKRRLYP